MRSWENKLTYTGKKKTKLLYIHQHKFNFSTIWDYCLLADETITVNNTGHGRETQQLPRAAHLHTHSDPPAAWRAPSCCCQPGKGLATSSHQGGGDALQDDLCRSAHSPWCLLHTPFITAAPTAQPFLEEVAPWVRKSSLCFTTLAVFHYPYDQQTALPQGSAKTFWLCRPENQAVVFMWKACAHLSFLISAFYCR